MPQSIIAYTDYKSPYAFLAKDMTYELERDFDVTVDWRPYTLDIPAYLGEGKVDDQGNVVEDNRNPHQWRRVRYSYMDCRRQANELGLTIRGTRKIFNSSIASIGMLYAHRLDVFRAYNDLTFERFWKRELNIEEPAVVAGVLAEAGADTTDFAAFADGEGREELDRLRLEAEDMGVFGVPTFVLDGELFWGREHLPMIRRRLEV
jgi:2-hydroxychromene-2-carboxylate isomerase